MRSVVSALIIVGVTHITSASATAATFTYLAEGTSLLYRKGTSAPPADWKARVASEATWTVSAAGFGIGYGDGDDRTVLSDMTGSYMTVYVRAHFTVGAERTGLQQLQLKARFDDGFVAYLNGTEVARASVPAGALSYDTAATSHEVTDGEQTFTISPSLLVDGDNVFAVEVHNSSLASSDLSFIPTLMAADTPGTIAAITLGPYVQGVERRSMVVCFETDIAVPTRVAHGSTQAYGAVAIDATLKTRHEIALTGLTPGATTYYRVESAAGATAAGQARTEADRAERLRVVAYGDNRSNPDDHAEVIAAVVDAGPDMVVNTGDLVESSTVSNWDTFFSVERPLLAKVMLLPAIGNHEGDAVLYREKFVLPADSPGGEKYYVRRFGSLAVVALDVFQSSYSTGTTQHQWAQSTLAALAADPGVRFIFVTLHHGPWSSGPHGSNLTFRTAYAPLFEQNKVAIVFAGHDHIYERSTAAGVKYIVTGGGGAPLYSASGAAWTEAKCSCRHFVVVDIDGATLHARAVGTDGTLIDEFWLGQGTVECDAGAQCASRDAGACATPDVGGWRCVNRACIWNCGVADAGANPSDAGTGADGGAISDGGSNAGTDAGADAGAGTDAGSEADAGAVHDAGAGPDAGTDGGIDWDAGQVDRPTATPARGCGCEVTGGPSSISVWLAALVLLGLLRKELYSIRRS